MEERVVANETLPFAERCGPWALIAGGSEGVGGSWASAIATTWRGPSVFRGAAGTNVLWTKAETEVREEHGVEVRTLSVDITSPNLLQHIDEVAHDLEVGMSVHNVGSTEREIAGPLLDDSLDVTVKTIRCQLRRDTFRAHVHERDAGAWPGRDRFFAIRKITGMAGQPLEATYSAAKALSWVFAEAS